LPDFEIKGDMMNSSCQKTKRSRLSIAMFIALLVGCADLPSANKPDAVPEIRPGILAGYLDPAVLPNSLALLPPPPAIGSAGFDLDKDVSRRSVTLQDTLRWELAIVDANLRFPRAADGFTCALGIPITEKDTPRLYMLLRRTLADAGFSTYNAKNHYRRKRPFAVNEAPICTPDEKEFLQADGSYPSGHTAIGWAWALILSEIAPERADAILARGRAYGESRIFCNVHWYSDVVAGRFMGAAAVARLHANPVFQAELKAAKKEVAAVRARGLKPPRDCEAESDALNYQLFRKP
jgi:acid phosphatase (class A)